jgi:hypothetical protein
MKRSKPSTSEISQLIEMLPTFDRERLCELWQQNFGRPAARGLRRELLLPILAYRIQERAYGGLKPEIEARLREIQASLDPKSRRYGDARLRYKPGTRLIREWNGEVHEVTLGAAGYIYKGESYKTLSRIACKITGAHWSGPAFFGTKRKELAP